MYLFIGNNKDVSGVYTLLKPVLKKADRLNIIINIENFTYFLCIPIDRNLLYFLRIFLANKFY